MKQRNIMCVLFTWYVHHVLNDVSLALCNRPLQPDALRLEIVLISED